MGEKVGHELIFLTHELVSDSTALVSYKVHRPTVNQGGARSPSKERRVAGTTRADADRSRRRDVTSATG